MKPVVRFEFYPLDPGASWEVVEVADGRDIGPFQAGDTVRLRVDGRGMTGQVQTTIHAIEVKKGRIVAYDATVEIHETSGPL